MTWSRFYKSAAVYAQHLAQMPRAHFEKYVAMARRFAPPGGRLLDAGCGTGQSACMLAEAGFHVVGADLSALFLGAGKCSAVSAAPSDPSVQAKASIALVATELDRLPFPDAAFDAVGAYHVIEHLDSPAAVLTELARVLRPGGIMLLRSPALASPVWPLIDLPNLARGRGGRPPHYRTPREAAAFLLRNLGRTARTYTAAEPAWEKRVPDLGVDVHGGDADAVYWSSTIEVAKYVRATGFEILQLTDSGRRFGLAWGLGKMLPWLAPTLAVVARKR